MKTSIVTSAIALPLEHGGQAPAARAPHDEGGFRGYLRDAAHQLAAGDRMLASVVTRGPTAPAMDTTSLLALQASMYRYTQELELAGRVVDRATQAVKTTLQSQS